MPQAVRSKQDGNRALRRARASAERHRTTIATRRRERVSAALERHRDAVQHLMQQPRPTPGPGEDVHQAVRMELAFRSLHIRSATMQTDADSGILSFTAVIASETPVPEEVYTYEEGFVAFDEILDPAGVNLVRGAIIPLLTDHNQWNVSCQIGDVSNIRVDPQDATQLIADIRIAGDDGCQVIRERVAAGIIKTFSCAYTVESYAYDETTSDEQMVLRATSWTLYEVSVVSVPADAVCTSRAMGALIAGGFRMPGSVAPQDGNRAQRRAATSRSRKSKPSARTAAEIQADIDALEDELQAADDLHALDDEDGDGNTTVIEPDNQGGERRRRARTEILPPEGSAEDDQAARDRALELRGRSLNAPREFVERYLGTSTTPQQLTALFHDHRVEETSGSRTLGMHTGGGNQVSDMGTRMQTQNRLIVRAAMAVRDNKVNDLGEEFRGILTNDGSISPKQMLRLCAARHNFRLPTDISDMTSQDWLGMRAVAPMVIADFQALAGLVMSTMQMSDEVSIPYWGTGIARQMEFTNFLAGRFTTPIIIDPLLETDPGAEVKAGGMRVYDTQGQPVTYNRRYPIGRQIWEGNGVNFFANWANELANAGITSENLALRNKILQNPVMSDSRPFFHGSRGNVGTGFALDIDGIGEVTGIPLGREDGRGIPFTGVIANPIHRTVLKQLAKDITPTEVTQYNPFGGTFTPYFMPRFPVNAFLWFCDPAVRPFLLRMVRAGQDSTQSQVIQTAQYDGFEILAYLDRGIMHGDPYGAFLAFTDAGPQYLPGTTTPANYEPLAIDDIIADQNDLVVYPDAEDQGA